MILDIVQHNNKIIMCLLMHLQREHFHTEANFWQYILYKALCHTHAFWFMNYICFHTYWLAHILHIHKASLETNLTILRSTSNTIIVNTHFQNKFWLHRHISTAPCTQKCKQKYSLTYLNYKNSKSTKILKFTSSFFHCYTWYCWLKNELLQKMLCFD